jgi:cyclic-di-GMP phosphodiesterase TipF (flagellum assembly factor)
VLQTLLTQFEQRTAKHKPAGSARPALAQAPIAKAPVADQGPPPHPIGHNRVVPAVRDGLLSEIEVQSILRHALQENRVDLYLQPIVSLPQRKVRFYEAYSRIRDDDGKMIVPDQYLHIAEDSGLITTIDNLLLFRCVQLIRKVKRRRINVGFFCNISARTLNDDFFFTQFLDFMEQNTELADSLIFEFSQEDVANHTAETEANLAKLAAMGFRFSMDQITTLDLDYMGLARRHIKFVKIDADLMLRDLGAGASPITIGDLKRDLTHTGVDLIAEKIENERSVADLVEFSVDFGQGFLFGEPRPAREPF